MYLFHFQIFHTMLNFAYTWKIYFSQCLVLFLLNWKHHQPNASFNPVKRELGGKPYLIKIAWNLQNLSIGQHRFLKDVDVTAKMVLPSVCVLKSERAVEAILRAAPYMLERDLLQWNNAPYKSVPSSHWKYSNFSLFNMNERQLSNV